jgi:ribonuclease P protein component
MKRRLRETFQSRLPELPQDQDYVLVVRPGLAEAVEARGFDWLGARAEEILGKAAA